MAQTKFVKKWLYSRYILKVSSQGWIEGSREREELELEG